MIATSTIADEILELKTERRAVILAHHYQEPEIQELADYVGDSLELARTAQSFEGDVIAFCGVRFLGETGKVIVSYINTSVEVKAESDILCTSRNAVKIVNSIPAHKPILFLPDINLGNYVKTQTGRQNMKIWQGACIVHATFPARRLAAARAEHPNALVAAHPECPSDVLRMADFIGSTSALVDWCTAQTAQEFIIMTESGVRFSLEKLSPGKKFYFVANENCNCSECPYMKMNSLEKLRQCLQDLEPRIEVEPDIMARALLPIQRMLAVK